MAHDTPMQLPDGVQHATRKAYALGCRCFECRRWNADTMKEYRHKKRLQGDGPKVKIPAGAGPFQVRVLKVIAEMGCAGEQAEMLHDLMVFNAKLLDSIPDSGRWHLAQSAQKTILELHKQLKDMAPGKPEGPEPEDDLGGWLNGISRAGDKRT